MAEYRYYDGTLRQGYFCTNCGETCNQVGTGHYIPQYDFPTDEWKCESNPKLVLRLLRANPYPVHTPHGIINNKPHYTCYAVAREVIE